MMIPPAILRIRIVEDHRKKIGLWIPIFILWPLLILLALLCLPLVLVLILVSLWERRAREILRVIFAVFEAIFALRGLTIDVSDEEEQILIRLT